MTDTLRTRSELIALLPDGVSAISAQDLRDWLLSSPLRNDQYDPLTIAELRNHQAPLTAAQINARISANTITWLPKGTYPLEGPIVMQNNRTLYAEDCRFVVPNSVAYPAFGADGKSNFHLYLNGSRIENQTNDPITNITSRHCVTFNSCSSFSVTGGSYRGGIDGFWVDSCSLFQFYNLDVRATILGPGYQFVDCSSIYLEDLKALNCHNDGLRLLANNRYVEIKGGEFANNGAPLSSIYIGTGLHIGQTHDIFIHGSPEIHHNMGSGLVWKSNLPPNSLYLPGIPWGSMYNLTIYGLTSYANGGNAVELRWERDTPDTVRPRNASLSLLRIHDQGSQSNGLYADVSTITVGDVAVWSTITPLGIVNNTPFLPTSIAYVNCTNSLVHYIV